jgi:hypothetical protein
MFAHVVINNNVCGLVKENTSGGYKENILDPS